MTYFVFRLVPLQAAYEWRFDVFFKYLPSILTGLKFTLLVMAGSMVLSVGIGLVAGLMRLSSQPILRLPATVYVDFFRTTPLLIQIVWIFYALPVLLGLGLDALSSGIIALSLNYGAFFAEVFKAGIVSLGKGQFEAGYGLGMTTVQVLRRVILPQTFTRMLPPIANMLVSLLKDTSLVSVIGIAELMYQARNINSLTFRPLEILTGVAFIYFFLTYPIALLAEHLHRSIERR